MAPESGGGADRTLRDLVQRVVTGAGFDLDDMTVTPAGRRRVIRVVIDRDDGVSLDAAADVSRALSDALDRDDSDAPLGGRAYTLEVTSRGVGRPLTLPRHFRRARTRLVSIVATDGRQLSGHVLDASDGAVTLVTGADPSSDVVVDLASIGRAVVEVEFKPPAAAVLARLGVDPADRELAPDPDAAADEGAAR